MNRRELARNGLFGLCGALLGLVPKPSPPVVECLVRSYTIKSDNGTGKRWKVSESRVLMEVPVGVGEILDAGVEA